MKMIQNLFDQQLVEWPLAQRNYDALKQVRVKELEVNGIQYTVQCNPARIVSSAAKVDTQSIQARKCFLCPANLPAEQKGIPFKSSYDVLVNPFPIFPRHFTIPTKAHTDQLIAPVFMDMLDLATYMEESVVFYNGPRCGASAPDHAHFQAGNKEFLPIVQNWKELKSEQLHNCGEATLWRLTNDLRNTLVIDSPNQLDANALFHIIYNALEVAENEKEPMMNILAWVEPSKKGSAENARWVVCIFPRKSHRPSCYTAEGEANILISPASVDMGGVFITPREADFEKITANDIATILTEVCLSEKDLQQLIERIKN